jgi:predicted RNA polymerase sigma factor
LIVGDAGRRRTRDCAFGDVEALSRELRHCHFFHATRAALFRDLGPDAEAAEADSAALALTRNRAERVLRAGRQDGARLA